MVICVYKYYVNSEKERKRANERKRDLVVNRFLILLKLINTDDDDIRRIFHEPFFFYSSYFDWYLLLIESGKNQYINNIN